MGGQACVLYGAAEFSRDTDIAILSQNKNKELETLKTSKDEEKVITGGLTQHGRKRREPSSQRGQDGAFLKRRGH